LLTSLALEKKTYILESDFIDDLGADSLYLNEIVYEIEEEFDLRVPDEAFDLLRTVGQAVEYIYNRVHEGR